MLTVLRAHAILLSKEEMEEKEVGRSGRQNRCENVKGKAG